MPLDLNQIRTLYREPKHKDILAAAAKDNAWQSFHARLSTCEKDAGSYVTPFLAKVKGILQNDPKWEVFKKLLSYPLPTQKIISRASDEWNKVFYAENRAIEVQMQDDSLQDDLNAYLEQIGFTRLMEQSIFTKAKQAVNTIAVVDLAALKEETEYPSPYVYLLDAGACHEIGVNDQGAITHLLYTTGKKGTDSYRLVVLDERYYRLFAINQGNEPVLLVESPHPLGYCPACFIWQDVVDPTQPIRRFNGVLEGLETMDKLVIADVFSQHADLYAAFPILWQYVNAGCSYSDTDGNPCVEGFIKYQQEGQWKEMACPVCSKQELIGPGTIKDVPLPLAPEQSLIGQPAGFVNADRTLLDYNVEKVQRLKDEIYRDLTGFQESTADLKGNKQYNEDQVASQNESRQAVLQYWAENLQFVHKFLLDAIAELRYGDLFISSSVNYGDEFLLVDADTATAWYESAKKAGLPMYLVAQKRRVVEQLYARTSPSQKERLDLLRQLEPFPDLNYKELPDGPAKLLKANFSAYIDRFERENGPLIRFGSALTMNERIQRITNQLYNYVRDDEGLLWQSGQGEETSGPTGTTPAAQPGRQPLFAGTSV